MMEPIGSVHGALVDLLERVLDKGLMIRTNIIITVAGVPLIAIDLHAAIAGMETMIENGMWADWDNAQRIYAANEWRKSGEGTVLDRDEIVQRRVLCSVSSDEGALHTWRLGNLYVTDKRIVLLRKKPYEVLLEIRHNDISGLAYSFYHEGNKEAELTLFTKRGCEAKLRSNSIRMVIGMIRKAMAAQEAVTHGTICKERFLPLDPHSQLFSGVTFWKKQDAYDEQGRKRSCFHLGHLAIEGGKVSWRGNVFHHDDFNLNMDDIDLLSVSGDPCPEIGERSVTLKCAEQSHVLYGNSDDVERAVGSLDRLTRRTGEAKPIHRMYENGLCLASPSQTSLPVGRSEKIVVGTSAAPCQNGRFVDDVLS